MPRLQGVVALPPTELDTWDVEDDIMASELAIERHLAMCEVRRRLPPVGSRWLCARSWVGFL